MSHMPHIYHPTITEFIEETIEVSGAYSDTNANGTYIKSSIIIDIPGISAKSYVWTKDGLDSYPRISRSDPEVWVLLVSEIPTVVYFSVIPFDSQTSDYMIDYYTGNVPTYNWQNIDYADEVLNIIYIQSSSNTNNIKKINDKPIIRKSYKDLYNQKYSPYGDENLSTDPKINQNKTYLSKNDGINISKSIYINKIAQAIRDDKFNLEDGKFTNGYPQTSTYDLCNQKLSIVYSLNKNQHSRQQTADQQITNTIINNNTHNAQSCDEQVPPEPSPSGPFIVSSTPTRTPTATPTLTPSSTPGEYTECPDGLYPAGWYCCPGGGAAPTAEECVDPTPTATRTSTPTPTHTITPTPSASTESYICDENWKWPISVVPLGGTTAIPGSITGLSSGAVWQNLQLINNPPRILKAGTTNGINFIIGETIEFITDNHPATMILDNLQYTITNIIYNDPAFVNIDAIYLTCVNQSTNTPTPTTTPTFTPTPTLTATLTPTVTNTTTPTKTPTQTPTKSPGSSATPTPTVTSTVTPTPTLTPTKTTTPSPTSSPAATQTRTPTPTPTLPISLKTMFIAWTDYNT